MRRLARPLLYLGTVGLVVGLGRYHAQFVGHYYFHSAERLPWTFSYAGIMCIAAYAVGLPDLDRRRWVWGAALTAVVTGVLAISALQLLLGSLLLPRFVVFSSAALALPWFPICVRLADIGRSRQEERDRVILVSAPDEQAAFAVDIEGDLERPVSLVGCLTPDEAHGDGMGAKPLVETVISKRGAVIVLGRTAALDETIVSQAAILHEAGLRVRSLSFFYDQWLGKLPLGELERMSLMFDVGELHHLRYRRMKRLCDVVMALIGVLPLGVCLPFVLLGNLVANRGPLFYRQLRVGRGSKSFEILKFRTMRPGSTVSEWTAAGDNRVTSWGRILRTTHLDELPQVLNILRGEQSVVGPRPEQPKYVAELREKIPFYDLRHLVRPGLTGWAQVKYPYGASEMDALEKLQYDFYYLRHQSIGLDLRIIGRTIRHVVGRAGR